MKGNHMNTQIRNLDNTTHEAAKVAATRQGISLNKYMIDAIRNAVLRSAQKDKAVAIVLESHKPARS